MMRDVISETSTIDRRGYAGRVARVRGALLEASGPAVGFALGAGATLHAAQGPVPCEIVGFDGPQALLAPFRPLDGVRPGDRVSTDPAPAAVRPCRAWLGRVIDAFGAPADGGPPLVQGAVARPLRVGPPPAHARARIGARLDTGVRALDLFTPICRGQRMGLFAGSGVGKSVLMSMLARGGGADVTVIGLIGERGREVREFVEDALGAEGLARSVVVAATSDEAAVTRRRAAYVAMATAEHFRDAGLNVLLVMDSVTRFALAQREIGLAAGEPPTTRGYTPSVFAELPRLLERAGPGPEGPDAGAITAVFTVLVEGGDHDEPVADAVRGVLDGHVVMDRAIAERGRYPAIDVLRSVSRAMPGCASEAENALLRRARAAMATYGDMEEMIRIGAYAEGSNAAVDEAARLHPKVEALLSQRPDERSSVNEAFAGLQAVLEEGPA